MGTGRSTGAVCVCDQPCRKPSDPSATIRLLAPAIPAFPAQHGHRRVFLALLHPPAPAAPPAAALGWGNRTPWSQRRHSCTPALKMDRRRRLAALSFFISTRFSPFLRWLYKNEAEVGGAFMTLQNLLLLHLIFSEKQAPLSFCNGSHPFLCFNSC